MTEYIIERQHKFSLGLAELIRYRELFYFFTWRDIKVKYKQAALGFLWAILQPLVMMLIFTLIFSRGLNVQSENIPYPIFALSGLIIWNIFSSGLLGSATSMVTNANIIKKIYFPRLIIPMSSILTALFDFCFALFIYIVVIIFYNYNADWWRVLYCLPIGIFLTVLTTFGMGTFFAAFNVKYRDFQYIIPFLIQFLLFANPVVYSSDIFKHGWLAWVMKLNPLANAINLSRSAFTGKPIDWMGVGLGFIIALIIFFIGIYTFRKTEAYFADLA
jgi:homopolymeric O-antigen transport system permease protein